MHLLLMKKNILHIIDDLGRGGAEVMLTKLVPHLSNYNNIVVTLNAKNHFTQLEFNAEQLYCLNMGGFSKFLLGAFKLRKFIKQHNIHLVHSHLFTATQVARFGVPTSIPLVTTIHTNVAASVEYNKWYMKLIEKFTYALRSSTIIGVSQVVLAQYNKHFRHKAKNQHLLYTFADVMHLQPVANKQTGTSFKLIAIGALRYPKNQEYLIRAMALIKNQNVILDIYGTGPKQKYLQQLINESSAKVTLKGEVKDAAMLMNNYDAFVMSSEFEGFSLSVLEAMAMKTPLLLSDIPSFKEQCIDTALYFNLSDVKSFVTQLQWLISQNSLQQKMINAAYHRLVNNFTLQNHLTGLQTIYNKVLDNKN
jgi:glycosyltransferase involved in cell wall biosynthesis